MGNLLKRGVKRERLFEKKEKSFYFSHLKKLYIGHLKMVPPQQQQQEEEERFPLPDLSAAPQIKRKEAFPVAPMAPEKTSKNEWRKGRGHLLPAADALRHLLLRRVPVGPAAARARQALVPLLVARVAHGVVAVPPGRLARAGRPGAAVRALPTSLEKESKHFVRQANGQNNDEVHIVLYTP